MAEIVWQITVFWPPALAQLALVREIFFETYFYAQMEAKNFQPKGMKGGRVIRAFIFHRVTQLPLPIGVGEIFIIQF